MVTQMPTFKQFLLSSTVLPVAIGFGISATPINAPAIAKPVLVEIAASCNPCNPCAAKNPCNPCAAKNPCNPCAAKNPCNPCAAKNPCNPCAAKNPCNPCAAKNPCNPCAAKNPCNPCAAKNPCNPCNPCGASAGLSLKCPIPRLAAATTNPCAAKSPCNPCAAKNPCNPCAASNPCNPCGASEAAEITGKEADRAYNCLKADIITAYGNTALPQIKSYTDWKLFNTESYRADTHGGRYLNNYANAIAAPTYGQFDELTQMPVGSVLVKDGITANSTGQTGISPLFVMEKMAPGFDSQGGDWRYTMIMPNGTTVGTTKGKGAAAVKFCAECHAAGSDNDYLLFLPEEYRIKG